MQIEYRACKAHIAHQDAFLSLGLGNMRRSPAKIAPSNYSALSFNSKDSNSWVS